MSFLSGSSPSIDMNEKDRFARAKESLENPHLRYNIGTYKERSQHLLLKLFYENDIGFHEVPFQGYIADILNDKGITEIQTVGFRALHDKLAVFLPSYPVTVVYPVCEKKRIMWTDPECGDIECGRYTTYPRRKFAILSELLSIVEHFGAPGLCIHLVSMAVSQYKVKDGYGKDKKLRATKLDTVPEELLEITELRDADDIRKLLPFRTGDKLLIKDISKALGLTRVRLWRAIKFLTITEILVQTGKKGNSIIYEVTAENE